MTRSPTPAELLEQEDFLRALVRRLLVDEHEVDDVVQQTWLQALTRPPSSPGRLRGWLAIVARNLARRQRRGESRRERREAAVSVGESLPPTDVIVERLELQRVLVDEVLALDEPYRTTVLLRFFDDLPVKELAVRMGVPVATVHTRLRRALDRLRGRLDRERDGDRRAWCLALLPVATGKRTWAATATAGASAGLIGMLAMTMQTKWTMAALALAIGAAAWWSWPEADETEALDVSTDGVHGETLDPLQPRAIELETSLEAESLPASETSTSDARPPSGALTGDLVVEAVWEQDGRPASGLWIELGPFGKGARVGPMLPTDADGLATFLSLEPGEVAVRPLRGGNVTSGQIVAGEASKLQAIIPRGIDVSGRVVDVGGRPIAGAEIWLICESDHASRQVVARADEDGTFSLPSVMSRHVAARAEGHRTSRTHWIAGSPGTERHLRLVLEGPAGGIGGRLVDDAGDPVAGATVSCGRREGVHVQSDSDGRFLVSGLAPAPDQQVDVYTERGHWRFFVAVAANATAEVEWRLDPAETARLVGELLWEGGEPLVDVPVQVGGNAERAKFSTRTDERGRFVLSGLLPGKTGVRTYGLLWLSEQIELLAGETAEWKPELGPSRAGGVIEGQVVDPDGNGLGGWWVRLQQQGNLLYEVTDALGRFRLTGSPEHEYEIRANPAGLDLDPPGAIRGGYRTGDGFVTLRVRADAVPSAFFEGRLEASNPRLAKSTDVWVNVEGDSLGITQEQYATVEDGDFRIGPLSPGSYQLYYRPAGSTTVHWGEYQLKPNEEIDVGVIRLEEAGAILGRLAADNGEALLLRSVRAETVGPDDTGWSTPAAIDGPTFEASPLEARRWQLWAAAEGYPTIDLGVHEIRPGERLDLGTIPVRSAGSLEVRPENAAKLDPTARFEVWSSSEEIASRRLAGSESVPLWPGRYQVIAYGESMADREHLVEVLAGEATTLVVEGEPAIGCLLVFTEASTGRTVRGHALIREKNGDRVLLDTPFEIAGDRLPGFYRELPKGVWDIRWSTPEEEKDGAISSSGRGLGSQSSSSTALTTKLLDGTGRVVRTARVSNDGKWAPTWFVRLAPGSYRLVIEDGGEPVEQTFVVEAGDVSRRRLIEIHYR